MFHVVVCFGFGDILGFSVCVCGGGGGVWVPNGARVNGGIDLKNSGING